MLLVQLRFENGTYGDQAGIQNIRYYVSSLPLSKKKNDSYFLATILDIFCKKIISSKKMCKKKMQL